MYGTNAVSGLLYSYASVSSDSTTMNRRIEDRVRKLAAQVVAIKDDQEQTRKVRQLRAALRQYIEQLRARLSMYPFGRERRILNEIPPSDTAPGNVDEPTRLTNPVEISK
jgi:hypothetical protein